MDTLELVGEGWGSLQGSVCVPRKKRLVSFASPRHPVEPLCGSLLFQRRSHGDMDTSLWSVPIHRREEGSWPRAGSRRRKAVTTSTAEWVVSLQSHEWAPTPQLASSSPWARHAEVGQQLYQSFLRLLHYPRFP